MNPLGGRALEIIDSMRSALDWIREIECDNTINLTPTCKFHSFDFYYIIMQTAYAFSLCHSE